MPDLSSARARVRLLALGAALVAFTGYRFGVSAFAWVAPVPFLLVLRSRADWKNRALVFCVLVVATTLSVGKIISDPVPAILAVPFAFPGAVGSFLTLLASDALRRRVGEIGGALGFAAATALVEIAQHASMPLGTWSSLAVTQIEHVTLLQLASLFGVAGIAFVMSLFAASLATAIAAPTAVCTRRLLAGSALLLAVVLVFGAFRIDRRQDGPVVRAAAVVTDLGLGKDGVPPSDVLLSNQEGLFARSELAVSRGAELVAWNEGATFVEPVDEPALVARGQTFARANGVDLVLAYAVVLRDSPLLLDNKYVWLGPDGSVVETYRKHHPVPGEPSLRGDDRAAAHDHAWGRAAGAICYDYDFPSTSRMHARLGAGLVVVPSSDWRGIDPVHTEITRLRAIESGVSVVRPTRFAASAAYDAYGRTRAALVPGDWHDGVMLATVPTTLVPTLYARAGDWPLGLGAGALLLVLQILALRKREGGDHHVGPAAGFSLQPPP